MIWPKDEEVKIFLDLHTLTIGDKLKHITYYIELMKPKTIKLSGRMKVLSKRVPAKLLVSPATVQLGTVSGKKQATVQLQNLTHSPMQIYNCSTSVEGVAITKKPLQVLPGESGQITLAINGEKLKPGSLRAAVTVETSFPEHAQVKVPINGIVPKK